MIQPISKTPEIKAKLQQEDKTSYLDKTEHIAAILTMNEDLQKFRNEFLEKDRNSNIQAENMN